MVTQISAYAEKLEKGKWSVSKKYDLDADYLFFTLLANVRKEVIKERYGNEIKAVYAPRGLPEDSAKELKDVFDSDDITDGCHNVSWLTPEEFLKVNRRYTEEEEGTNGYTDVLSDLMTLKYAFEKVRFVFGFFT